jgi:protein involved in plasmid replication-relaxation
MMRRGKAAGMRNVQRVRQAHVEWVDARLSERDRKIISTVDRLRLVSSLHLERLHFQDLLPSVRGRVRRRVLARLVAWRVLLKLERRIGGVRAGSSGLVFALDTAGQQLAALDGAAVRRSREPSVALLGHSLAASELYVSLMELSQAGGFTVADYLTEPACWWPLPLDGWLKPDAYLKLTTPAFDDHWWIEVDKGTEHLPTIRRKLLAYLDYANSGGLGPGSVLPRVLVTVPSEARQAAIVGAIARLPDADRLIHVTTEGYAPEYLLRVLRE